MPELPEVETTVRILRELILNKPISNFQVLPSGEKLFKSQPYHVANQVLLGKKFTAVNRKGKYILLENNSSHPLLVVHLRMTGRFLYLESAAQNSISIPTLLIDQKLDFQKELPDPYTRVIMQFNDNQETLYFSDLRRFATLDLLQAGETLPGVANLGIDALSDELTGEYLAKIGKKSTTQIYKFLLDQTKIAGIGNIYANEALYLAKIDPRRPVNDLKIQELDILVEKIKEVLNDAVASHGTSLHDYLTPQGEAGTYQQKLHVYSQKEVERDGKIYPVKRVKMGGRSMWYVPEVQK